MFSTYNLCFFVAFNRWKSWTTRTVCYFAFSVWCRPGVPIWSAKLVSYSSCVAVGQTWVWPLRPCRVWSELPDFALCNKYCLVRFAFSARFVFRMWSRQKFLGLKHYCSYWWNYFEIIGQKTAATMESQIVDWMSSLFITVKFSSTQLCCCSPEKEKDFVHL